MDATHQPAQIGVCPTCQAPLYDHAPLATPAGVVPSHVACAVFARRGR